MVTVTFEPRGDAQTLMTIHHTLPARMAENYQQGWTRIAGQLDDQLIITP